ncbi:hypothetical protein C2E23DRAFT_15854 [Lenzites betulinus]|nr:hypothetical protein C2E23DRAFT_15854 [Lenzites betulinus]
MGTLDRYPHRGGAAPHHFQSARARSSLQASGLRSRIERSHAYPMVRPRSISRCSPARPRLRLRRNSSFWTEDEHGRGINGSGSGSGDSTYNARRERPVIGLWLFQLPASSFQLPGSGPVLRFWPKDGMGWYRRTTGAPSVFVWPVLAPPCRCATRRWIFASLLGGPARRDDSDSCCGWRIRCVSCVLRCGAGPSESDAMMLDPWISGCSYSGGPGSRDWVPRDLEERRGVFTGPERDITCMTAPFCCSRPRALQLTCMIRLKSKVDAFAFENLKPAPAHRACAVRARRATRRSSRPSTPILSVILVTRTSGGKFCLLRYCCASGRARFDGRPGYLFSAVDGVVPVSVCRSVAGTLGRGPRCQCCEQDRVGATMVPVLPSLLCSWLAFGLVGGRILIHRVDRRCLVQARFQLASVEVDASVASFAAPSAMFRNQL